MVGLIAGFPQQAIFRAIQGRNKGSGNGNPDAGTIDEMQSAKRVATRVKTTDAPRMRELTGCILEYPQT